MMSFRVDDMIGSRRDGFHGEQIATRRTVRRNRTVVCGLSPVARRRASAEGLADGANRGAVRAEDGIP